MPSSQVGPRLRGAIVALLAAALAVGWVTPAQADPHDTPSAGDVARARQAAQDAASEVGRLQAKLAKAKAKRQALIDDAERAVEAYNGAVYLLGQAKSAAADAQARADAAAADLATAQRAVDQFAAASYRMGGGLGTFATMLDANGPQDLMNQASDLANIATSNNTALARVQAARIVATVLQEQATTALGQQTAATERVKATKNEAQAKVDAQTAQLGALKALTHRLNVRLAAARAHAGSVSQQRKDGLAAAARERAAREARRRAAAAAGSGGGQGNPDLSNNPSGWSPSFEGGTQYGTSAGATIAIAFARAQLGKPYQWGATGPDRFDCSGLTLGAWGAAGVALPHWTVAQFAQAKKIPASEARPGDLVFFAYDIHDPATIHHVGLYIGNGRMIHAPHTGDVVREADLYSVGLIGFARP